MQTPHSGSLQFLVQGGGNRRRHEGYFKVISPLPTANQALINAYANYAAEGRDIADQQIAQLRGAPPQHVPLSAGLLQRAGFGTRGMLSTAGIQRSYVSPLRVSYELSWLHIGDIVAARMHCYPVDYGHNLTG